MALTQQQQQELARGVGYTGPFGSGGFNTWLASNPAAQKQYTERAAAREQGYTGPFGNNAYNNWLSGKNTYDTGGVMPVGVVEPFNEYQKQGIEQLATAYTSPLSGQANAAFDRAVASVPDTGAMFTQGSDFYNQGMASLAGATNTANMAIPAIQSGMREMTDADFSTGLSRYMNPYQQEVIDRTLARINEQADITRNRIKGSFAAGGNSFGSTAQGVELSELAKNLLGQVGDTTASLNAANYTQAADRTQSDFNNARSRDLTGAGLYGSTAGVQSGIGGTQVNAGNQRTAQGYQGVSELADLARLGFTEAEAGAVQNQRNISNLLTGGQMIQDQNQRILDVVGAERNKMLGFDDQQLAQLAALLGAFPTTSSATGSTAESTNTLGKLGGAGLTIAGGVKNAGGWGNFLNY